MEDRVTERQAVDVLIVGAGLSGLTTAYRLLQKDKNLHVRILEASEHVGGKLCETHLGELGAKWISEQQYHMWRLLQAFGVPMLRRACSLDDPHNTSELPRCWDLDTGATAGLAKFELKRYLRELELRMSKYHAHKCRYDLQMQSMESHICQSLFFSASRRFMRNLVLLASGALAHCITYEEFMTICASCGGLSRIIDIYLMCPPTLIEFSSNELLYALLRELRSVEILTEHKVQELRPRKDYIEVYDHLLCKHKASVVVLAIPWSNIQQIYVASPLPANYEPPLHILLRKSKYSVSSFLLKYSEAHWQNAGYSGQFMCSDPFVFGNEYRENVYCCHVIHPTLTDCNWEHEVVHTLAEHFGDAMRLPIELTRRTYELSYLSKSAVTRLAWQRVIWSSSSVGATANIGCLGGAVQSGLHAALRALRILRPQTVSWHDEAELCCRSKPKPDASWLTLWESTLNLYNVTYYGMLIGVMIGALRFFGGRC